MYHLLIAVMAIGLSALLITGGVQYMDANRAVSTETSLRVVTSYRAIEMAFASYRIANGGALPDMPDAGDAQSEAAPWREQISPYAAGAVFAPNSLAWSYGSGVNGAYVCLSNASGAKVSKGMQDGLDRAVRFVGPAAVLGKACGDVVAAPAYDGTAALTFSLSPRG